MPAGYSVAGALRRLLLSFREKHLGLQTHHPMKNFRPFAFCVLLAISLVPAGCGTLDKSGVYQGDAYLYQSELAIRTSYDVVHTYVSWEFANRAALASNPDIQASADVMRAHAREWFRTANALHDAYKSDPSAPNKQALQAILDILRAALTEAAQYMTAAATNH